MAVKHIPSTTGGGVGETRVWFGNRALFDTVILKLSLAHRAGLISPYTNDKMIN